MTTEDRPETLLLLVVIGDTYDRRPRVGPRVVHHGYSDSRDTTQRPEEDLRYRIKRQGTTQKNLFVRVVVKSNGVTLNENYC